MLIVSSWFKTNLRNNYSWSATHQAVATECAAAPEHAHRETWGLTRCGEGVGAQGHYPHSPDKQQDEAVQSPLHGAEPDALDPHQLGGFILTQSAETAAHHDEPEEESLTHFFSLLPVWTVTCPDVCSCSQLSLPSHIFTLPLPPSHHLNHHEVSK